MREFSSFSWKEANFRLSSPNNPLLQEEIKKQRRILEDYICRDPVFGTSLAPVSLLNNAPEIVRRMHEASSVVGIGPMAAVAGIFAELAAEALLLSLSPQARSQADVIVENGGDLYLSCSSSVQIGLWAGTSSLSGKLALAVEPEATPLAVCSSSSTMGHSLSFGHCDLATVTAKDAALADAAATHLSNMIQTEDDIHPSLERLMTIPGIAGALAIKEENIGLIGDLPPLVRLNDPALKSKITRAQGLIL